MMATIDDLSIQNAIQWILEDLFNGREPREDDWSLLPQSDALQTFESLRDASRQGKANLVKVFNALCKDEKYCYLRDLRSKALPSRDGNEEAEQDARFKIGKTGKKVIVRFTEDDIEALPDKEDLIKDILEKGTVSMIYGPSGTGKTFNALHIAYCVAHGFSWFGHEVAKGKVWYINTEGGRGLKPRIAAWRKEYKRGKTANIEFITWPVHLKDHSQELLDTVEEADDRPALLVVDNYSMCATGTDQNNQMEVTRTLMVLHEIAQKYGCHCLLVHHSNWTGKVNGSAAFRNHVDTMLDLSQPSKDSPLILLKCEKQRDGAPFADIHIELKIISPYAHPVTGANITSCVVVQSDAPVLETLGSKQQQCLDLLADGMTLAEWQKLIKGQMSISDRTVERYRDLFESKGLIRKKEVEGKHPTYWHVWHGKANEVSEDE
jgi:AAA domain